jgi:flavin reductase (DIM6/NTAB) family NADH-FMN oxidoreductase RutF
MERGVLKMKKIYETPVVVITAFDSEDMTNGILVSSVTSFSDIKKSESNTIDF